MPIPAGTIVERHSGGGGGFGDPLARPVENVAEDLRNGLISPDKAERDYAVAADGATLAVDVERTRALRARRLAP